MRLIHLALSCVLSVMILQQARADYPIFTAKGAYCDAEIRLGRATNDLDPDSLREIFSGKVMSGDQFFGGEGDTICVRKSVDCLQTKDYWNCIHGLEGVARGQPHARQF